jgi:hypothetical protein
MVRIGGGFYEGMGPGRWIATEFDALYKNTDGYFICGAGAEIKNLGTSYVLHELKNWPGKNRPKKIVLSRNIKPRKMAHPVTIYSYCVPMDWDRKKENLSPNFTELTSYPVRIQNLN